MLLCKIIFKTKFVRSFCLRIQPVFWIFFELSFSFKPDTVLQIHRVFLKPAHINPHNSTTDIAFSITLRLPCRLTQKCKGSHINDLLCHNIVYHDKWHVVLFMLCKYLPHVRMERYYRSTSLSCEQGSEGLSDMLWMVAGKLYYANQISSAIKFVCWGHATGTLSHYSPAAETSQFMQLDIATCCLETGILILLAWAMDQLDQYKHEQNDVRILLHKGKLCSHTIWLTEALIYISHNTYSDGVCVIEASQKEIESSHQSSSFCELERSSLERFIRCALGLTWTLWSAFKCDQQWGVDFRNHDTYMHSSKRWKIVNNPTYKISSSEYVVTVEFDFHSMTSYVLWTFRSFRREHHREEERD